MPTRRQDPENKTFRQGAFASSAEYERGILGNLVAARCHKLTDPEEIAMIWWLQQVSWRDGGMEKFVGDNCPDRELSVEAVANELKAALVDPESNSLRNGLWWFPDLWKTLHERRQSEIDAAASRIVETEVTRQIAEELDFALETRSFVLIEGREGIGKTEAARVWCDQHPGRAIYVRLEAGSDETTLFRSIARRVGTACSYQRKAVEMRARIQDALQGGHLMLVLDEAHFLWPQSDRSERTVPKRLDWLRTALVDFGVPVAMVSTPQHFSRQCDRFRKNGWNANQIQRRLARTATLPESLSAEDAVAMARSYFPACPNRLLKRTAGAALLSVDRLTLFSHMRKRVDFFSSRRPGYTEAELLEVALAEIGAPGGATAGTASEPVAEPVALPVQWHRNRITTPLPQTEISSRNRLVRTVGQLVPAGI